MYKKTGATTWIRAVILKSAALFIALYCSAAICYDGTTEGQYSFSGPVSGFEVVYSIYLPPGYAEATADYPVIYWYGGLGSSPDPNGTVISVYENSRSAGDIVDAIIVFVNVDNNSYYHDSKDGSRPIGTSIAVDLVNYINENYRVKTNRGNRVAMGFSMGGGGSISHWAKYPETFSIAVELDGAVDQWDQLGNDHPDIRSAMYEDDEEYFNTQSSWSNIPLNAEYLVANSVIIQIMGDHTDENIPMRDLIDETGITHEWYESGCGHDEGCILGSEYGPYAFQFIQAHLADPVAITEPLTVNRVSGNENIRSNAAVFDLQGKLVRRMTNSELLSLSTQRSAGGMYLMRIGTGTQYGSKDMQIVK